MPGRNCAVPPAFETRATAGSQAGTGLLPARNWMSAPELTRDSRTEATVTGRPMSSSSPVPRFSAPNRAVAYHWLIQGRARSPPMASAAPCWSSPSPRPAGPNAATLAAVSVCTATGLAVEGLAVGDDWDALA